MNVPPDPPTRHEFQTLSRRVNAIYRHGSKPVMRMAAQLAVIARDLADLKQEFEQAQERHEERRRARVTGRRWVIGTCLAAVVAVAAMMTLLLQILGRIR